MFRTTEKLNIASSTPIPYWNGKERMSENSKLYYYDQIKIRTSRWNKEIIQIDHISISCNKFRRWVPFQFQIWNNIIVIRNQPMDENFNLNGIRCIDGIIESECAPRMDCTLYDINMRFRFHYNFPIQFSPVSPKTPCSMRIFRLGNNSFRLSFWFFIFFWSVFFLAPILKSCSKHISIPFHIDEYYNWQRDKV